MLRQSLRASRSAAGSIARIQTVSARRTFIAPTAALRADLVQDMYLREIKNYKAPPVKASDADAHVQKFTPPKAPQSPEDGDIAADLKAYEEQQVEVEGGAAGGESGANPVEHDWFEGEDEAADQAPAMPTN